MSVQFTWRFRTSLGLMTSAEVEVHSGNLTVELSCPSFYDNYPHLVLLLDGAEVFDAPVLEPRILLGGLLESGSIFEESLAILIAEEEEAWLIYSQGGAVRLHQADFELAAELGGTQYLSRVRVGSDRLRSFEGQEISMDLVDWLRGVLELGRQYVQLIQTGLPLLAPSDAAELAQFERICLQGIDRIEHALR